MVALFTPYGTRYFLLLKDLIKYITLREIDKLNLTFIEFAKLAPTFDQSRDLETIYKLFPKW
jgi:hypothetical protein